MMRLLLRFFVSALCYLIRFFVSVFYPLSYLFVWLFDHVRTVLFYGRRSSRKPRHLNPDFAAGLEWEMTKFLMYLFLIGLALVLVPRAFRAAAVFLRRVDLRLCWSYTKRAIGALVAKWRRVDLRLCWRYTKRAVGALARKLRMIGQLKLRVEDNRLPENLPKRFSFRELRAATGEFSDENKIGSGQFGVVYKGVLGNGNVIAVKRLSKRNVAGSTQDAQWQFDNEARALQLRHGNIAQLVGYCCERQHRLLCYEYMANGSLDSFIFCRSPQHIVPDAKGARPTLDWAARYKIIKGICCGLRYLHEECKLDKNMLHLDIKPSNILLDDDMNPKISDFGLSRLFDRGSTHTIKVIAPVGYSAPEYRHSGKVSEKTDIFSFGIVLLEIATGRHNENDENDEFVIYAERLASGKEPPPAYVKNEYGLQFRKCINIGLKCVTHENRRPTAGEVMNMIEAGENERPTAGEVMNMIKASYSLRLLLKSWFKMMRDRSSFVLS